MKRPGSQRYGILKFFDPSLLVGVSLFHEFEGAENLPLYAL